MNKTYAFTDLHGRYELWRQIKEYCDETDTLYFLGDACDRGDDGLRIIIELLQDKRVKYIKGNHEEFLEDIGADVAGGHYSTTPLWRMNGGFSTLQDFEKLAEESQEYFVRKMARLPLIDSYVNKKGQTILLSHAGYTPTKEWEGKKISNYLWDRDHVYDDWPSAPEYKETYVVHGHTPVDCLRPTLQMLRYDFTQEQKYSPIYYCEGHKIDLDLASFDSGFAILFDLDELKVAHKFFDETILEEYE